MRSKMWEISGWRRRPPLGEWERRAEASERGVWWGVWLELDDAVLFAGCGSGRGVGVLVGVSGAGVAAWLVGDGEGRVGWVVEGESDGRMDGWSDGWIKRVRE